MTESNRIEYKLGLTEDLEKEAVAFLNYQEEVGWRMKMNDR